MKQKQMEEAERERSVTELGRKVKKLEEDLERTQYARANSQ